MNLNSLDFERDLMFLIQRIKSLGENIDTNELRILKLTREIEEISKKEDLYNRSREIYKVVVDEVYNRSLGEIEEVLNMSLQYIFFDKNYTSKIEVSDFRNKTINLYLYDNEFNPARIVDMKDGVGNGIRTVVSFVLLAYYLITLNRMPFIFADEAYSGISEAYVDRFFSFISSLCEKKGLKFVLITHDPRFLLYGNKKYSVSEGIVTEIVGS